MDCVCYNEDFVKSRFCCINFTVVLARLKKIVVIQRSFKSRSSTVLCRLALSSFKQFFLLVLEFVVP